jgi:Holliday junction resolvase RusA-like endonuclease
VIKFVINARPQPKERSRSTKRGHHYTPQRTVNFELTVAMEFRRQYPNHKPLTGPVGLHVAAKYKRPKTKKKGFWHTGPGDLDNIVKGISDGLNKLAWADDRQVAELTARKSWGESDMIQVWIWPLEE